MLYTFSLLKQSIGGSSHPKPDNLSEAAIRVEVALERHSVSNDDVRKRINGDAQVTCRRELQDGSFDESESDFTAAGASSRLNPFQSHCTNATEFDPNNRWRVETLLHGVSDPPAISTGSSPFMSIQLPRLTLLLLPIKSTMTNGEPQVGQQLCCVQYMGLAIPLNELELHSDNHQPPKSLQSWLDRCQY